MTWDCDSCQRVLLQKSKSLEVSYRLVGGACGDTACEYTIPVRSRARHGRCQLSVLVLSVLALVLALALASGVAGLEPRDIPVAPAAADAFNLARRLVQAGDLPGAEREYVAAIRHTPDFPHALTALADLRLDMGRTAEAEKMYLQVIRSHPTWFQAASSLGFLYMEAGVMDKAIQQLARVATMNPSASALLNLGAAQKQAGNLPDAIASYRRARLADPAEPRGAYNLGNALYAHGDFSAAIEQYRESSRLNPTHTDSLNNMANALRDAGDRAGSQRTLEQAVALDPSNVAALCNLGGQYYDIDDFGKSLHILDRALALAPLVPEVICSRANTLHRLNQTDVAIAEYTRVVEGLPTVQAYRRGLADLLSAAGRLQEAVAQFESAFTHGGGDAGRGPDAAAVLSGLAEAYRKQGNASRAIEMYQKAATAHPADPRIHMNAAVVLADERRLAEAIPSFRHAIALKPDDPLVLSNFGTVLHRLGDFKESAHLYSEALRLTPASPNLHYNLGNSMMDLAIQTDVGLLRESVKEYTACLSLDATYPGAMNNLGNALKEMDRFTWALRAWQTALRIQGARHPDVFSNMVHLRMFICDWDGWAQRYHILEEILTTQLAAASISERGAEGAAAPGRSADAGSEILQPNKTSVSCQPFHALLYAHLSLPLVLAIARTFAREVQDNTRHFSPYHRGPSSPPLPVSVGGLLHIRKKAQLRIGYLSHDFGDHPTGHLFNSVPSLHVRGGGVEAVYFTLKGHEESRYWRRLVRDAGEGRVVDVTSVSFDTAAAMVNSWQLHVLVDLDVWMKGRRPGVCV